MEFLSKGLIFIDLILLYVLELVGWPPGARFLKGIMPDNSIPWEESPSFTGQDAG